jgi:hypothetical protein
MCYSAEMSLTLAVSGALCTAASIMDPALRAQLVFVPFAFYTLMELLQAWQYTHANLCGAPANAVSTEAAYALVVVQPLLWNVIYYLRTPEGDCERRLFQVGMVMGLLWIAVSVYARARQGRPGVETRTEDAHAYVPGVDGPPGTAGCTKRAEGHHIYWQWASADLGGVDANWLMYMAVWFVPALISRRHRRHVAIIMSAAALAAAVTWRTGAVSAEFASLWCAYSIPFLVALLVDAFCFGGRA